MPIEDSFSISITVTSKDNYLRQNRDTEMSGRNTFTVTVQIAVSWLALLASRDCSKSGLLTCGLQQTRSKAEDGAAGTSR